MVVSTQNETEGVSKNQHLAFRTDGRRHHHKISSITRKIWGIEKGGEHFQGGGNVEKKDHREKVEKWPLRPLFC